MTVSPSTSYVGPVIDAIGAAEPPHRLYEIAAAQIGDEVSQKERGPLRDQVVQAAFDYLSVAADRRRQIVTLRSPAVRQLDAEAAQLRAENVALRDQAASDSVEKTDLRADLDQARTALERERAERLRYQRELSLMPAITFRDAWALW